MRKSLITPTKYIVSLIKENEVGNIIEILLLIKRLVKKERHSLINSLFCQRNAEKILKDGFSAGCHDETIVFCSLAIAAGLKPTYVEALEKAWLEDKSSSPKIRGHTFVEVSGVLVDPQRKIIYVDQDWILLRYVIYGKASEPYDLGLTSFGALIKKFMDFKEKYQKYLPNKKLGN